MPGRGQCALCFAKLNRIKDPLKVLVSSKNSNSQLRHKLEFCAGKRTWTSMTCVIRTWSVRVYHFTIPAFVANSTLIFCWFKCLALILALIWSTVNVWILWWGFWRRLGLCFYFWLWLWIFWLTGIRGFRGMFIFLNPDLASFYLLLRLWRLPLF